MIEAAVEALIRGMAASLAYRFMTVTHGPFPQEWCIERVQEALLTGDHTLWPHSDLNAWVQRGMGWT